MTAEHPEPGPFGRIEALLRAVLEAISGLHVGPSRPVVLFVVGTPVPRVGVVQEGTPVAITIADDQKVPVTVGEVDDQGNAVGPVAGLAASSSDTTIATAQVEADGTTVTVSSVGPIGQATVTLSGNGADGNPLTSLDLLVDVVASAPVGIGVQVGTPVPR